MFHVNLNPNTDREEQTYLLLVGAHVTHPSLRYHCSKVGGVDT